MNSKYQLKPNPALLNLINQLNNYSNEQNDEDNQNMPEVDKSLKASARSRTNYSESTGFHLFKTSR